MKKIKYMLLPLSLLVGLFIPTACEDTADDLADALAGGDAMLLGTWTATEMRQYDGENCDSLTRTRTDIALSMTFSQNSVANRFDREMDAAGFCTDFFEGSIDGNTCTTPAECDCDDADGDCDRDATTESDCTAGGGDWDEEEALDMTDSLYLATFEMMCSDGNAPCDGGTFNSATNTCALCQEPTDVMNVELEIIDDTSFRTTQYECDCEDSNGNDIEGCDDDEIETESACTTAGGDWEADTNLVQYEISGNTLTLTEKHVHDSTTECIVWTLTKN